jgi:hypothetical protein
MPREGGSISGKETLSRATYLHDKGERYEETEERG